MKDNEGVYESQRAFLASHIEALVYNQRTERAEDQAQDLRIRIAELQIIRKTR